jgi:hypothetical protein
MTENEITMLMLQIADIGVTGIMVKYEGSGDDGAVEWVGYTKEPCHTPEDVNENIDEWTDEHDLNKLDSGICSLIENFAHEKLLNDIEDWWNSEGGFGELCICIPSGRYIINNHVRITETEDHFHDGNILDKRSDV